MNSSFESPGFLTCFRVLFGLYLLVHFSLLLPYGTELFSNLGMLADAGQSPLFGVLPNLLQWSDSPSFVMGMLVSGVLASVLLLSGKYSRAAAFWLWFLLLCLFARNPLIANPALPYVGWMLLAWALMPSPRESSDAQHVRMRSALFLCAWVILALSYSYSGYTKLLSPSWVAGDAVRLVLDNPLARDHLFNSLLLAMPEYVLQSVTWAILYVELLFAPLALLARIRPWLWGGMLLVQFGFLVCLNFADLTTAMLLFHLFTFDARWVKPVPGAGRPAILFYDGDCAFCHYWVRFVLREDAQASFHFSPIGGGAWQLDFDVEQSQQFPDSIVLSAEEGAVFIKSDAVIAILQRLGGFWGALGIVLSWMPKKARDLAYDAVGRVRYRLFGRTSTQCPLVPEALRKRFV